MSKWPDQGGGKKTVLSSNPTQSAAFCLRVFKILPNIRFKIELLFLFCCFLVFFSPLIVTHTMQNFSVSVTRKGRIKAFTEIKILSLQINIPFSRHSTDLGDSFVVQLECLIKDLLDMFI